MNADAATSAATPAAATARPTAVGAPEKPSLDGLEAKWVALWEEHRTYRFDRTRPREDVYSIDTPPPTVSGSLSVGHVFSYTQTDAIARYQRMRGKSVFYPLGFDDNGLPTERRVQNVYGVRCDPALPYDPDFVPARLGDGTKRDIKNERPISRRNFVQLCRTLAAEDEAEFAKLWARVGLSVDWSMTYQTISGAVQGASQRGFLANLARGEAYQAQAPTLWDVSFQTAVAQAELEERDRDAAYHRVAFHAADGGGRVYVETTRPELLPACVALVAHPGDERFQPLFGQTVRTPLFDVAVPVVAHRLAEPDKGAGIAMICTFGDTTDVTWWRELDLPTRPVIGRDGRLVTPAPDWLRSDTARTAYERIAGKTPFSAQREIVGMLDESGDLDGEPKPITHPVKFYERGDRPLEIVTSRQWYLRNGGRDLDLRAALIARGRELVWYPPHMRHRYENWVEGLTGDWLVSRQRFFGVPIPVWYAVGSGGEPDYGSPLLPADAALPIDPATDVPAGYEEAQRGQLGGFVADPDILDTWATSSLSPQFTTGWRTDPDLFARTFPMDLRPQGHDIIRTWLFASIVRAHLENGSLPWRAAAISGMILDPHRKEMHKSAGNVVTPIPVLERFGTDAFRYWACSGRLGLDLAFEEGQLKVGRRLAVKLLNASKFALGAGMSAGADPDAVTEPLDRALLAELAGVVEAATAAYEDYNFAAALDRTERFFWTLCDDYLELVKARAYGTPDGRAGTAASGATAARSGAWGIAAESTATVPAGGVAVSATTRSARAALSIALSTVLRLFAPVLPFVTEEVWSWWQLGCVHRSLWPTAAPLRAAAGDADPGVLTAASTAISAVRKAKSDAKLSMRTEIAAVRIRAPEPVLGRLQAAADDLRTAGRIGNIDFEMAGDPATEPYFQVTL